MFLLFSLCLFPVLHCNSTGNCAFFLVFAFYTRRDSFNSTLVAHILVWGSHKPYLSPHTSPTPHKTVPVHFFCVTCSAFRIPWHNSHLVPCNNTVETPRQTGQIPISRMHEVPRSPQSPIFMIFWWFLMLFFYFFFVSLCNAMYLVLFLVFSVFSCFFLFLHDFKVPEFLDFSLDFLSFSLISCVSDVSIFLDFS